MDESVNGLSYSISQSAGACVLTLRGEIDLATGHDFSAQLSTALDASDSLLFVDMSGVDFLGSAGLAALIRFQDEAGQRGIAVRLVCGHAARRTIELTGLAEQFVMAGDVPSASTKSADAP